MLRGFVLPGRQKNRLKIRWTGAQEQTKLAKFVLQKNAPLSFTYRVLTSTMEIFPDSR